MPEKSDESLQRTLFAAAGGDEQAWRELVDTYADRVFALLRVQCGNADLAEEVTQSTFCTVAAKLRDYVEVGRFEPWLFRIAVNRLRDEIRRRRRHAVAVDSDALAAMAGTVEARAGSVESDEEIHALRQAMARLPEIDRQVVHLRHYAGLSFRQIAEMLEHPLGTVLARHHRALKKLADLIREPPVDEDGCGLDAQEAAIRSEGRQ